MYLNNHETVPANFVFDRAGYLLESNCNIDRLFIEPAASVHDASKALGLSLRDEMIVAGLLDNIGLLSEIVTVGEKKFF